MNLNLSLMPPSLLDVLPPSAFVQVAPTKSALKSALANYAGKKVIVLPQSDTPITIDERIVTTKKGVAIVNFPPKSCQLNLSVADACLSIENPDADGDWNTRSWYLENLLIDGQDIANVGITTEYGASGRRTLMPIVRNCTLRNFPSGKKLMNLKDTEAPLIMFNNLVPPANGIGVRLFQSEDRQIGNAQIIGNEVYFEAANAIAFQGDVTNGVYDTAVPSLGAIGCFLNHFIGDMSFDSLAYDLKGYHDGIRNFSNNYFTSIADRFEQTRILTTTSVGSIARLKIQDFTHTCGYAAAARNHIDLGSVTKNVAIKGAVASRGGGEHAGSRFVNNLGVSTNGEENTIHDCQLSNWGIEGAANPWASVLNTLLVWKVRCYGGWTAEHV